jgi:beta-galactosidase
MNVPFARLSRSPKGDSRHLFLRLALPLLVGTVLAAEVPLSPSPAPVIDGSRTVLDLAGTWEAQPADWMLPFPPAEDGWTAHAVPHPETNLLDSDDIGPYFPRGPEAMFEADNRTPKRKDKLAAWFRRSFTVPDTVPAGMRAILVCDGIAWHSEIWLNGAKVGESVLGMAPNAYDVSGQLRAGDNQLVIGVAGRVRLWDPERKTFIAPITGSMPGIWNSVRLEIVPELRIDDVFVRTSVDKKRIEVDVTVMNDGSGERVATPAVTILDPVGRACLGLSGAATAVPAGKTATVTLSADWLATHLWSPATPNLHQAETVLREGAAELDRVRATFGFREFTAKGRDFLLNGRRQVLLRNSWLSHSGALRDRVLPNVTEELTNFNCIRQHLCQINPHVIDQADRVGMMVIPEFWGFYQNSNKQFPITQTDAWLPNTVETMQRVVKQYRNHPSVILWSVTNETFWNSVAPEHMAVADALVKAIRAADPTRLLQADAEITYEGRLETIGIHYPEGDAGTVGKQYDNSGWVIPNDFAWLKKEGPNHSWRADFVWDRPLMIGEYFCQDGDEPERYTAYVGDEAYDTTKWRWQAMNGRDAIMPRTDNPWIRMVKMNTDHYRAAGVACLNPWTGIGHQIMPKFLVAPLDYHPTAFGGDSFPRRFVVANDSALSHNEIHLQAGLLVNGREVWGERKIPCHVEPGDVKEVTLAIKAPTVKAQVRGRLIVRLCWMRGPVPYELGRHEEDLWIAPRANLTGVDAAAVALVDTDDGATGKALSRLGLTVTPGVCDDAGLSGKRLLVIGEGAAAKADLPAASRFAEGGGRVLILHQTQLDAFLPGQPEIDPKHAASFSWSSASHPILAGLDEGQLRFWRPDHLVATESLVRPSAGAAMPLAASGGRYGMHWSPLAEIRHGKGAVTFCQYLLVQRTLVEPAAARILIQAIRAGVEAAPAKPAPALRLASGISKDCRAVLAACHVRTEDGFAGAGPILVDAAQPPDAATLKRLRAEVAAGRTLWLRGLDEKTAPDVAALLPWTPGFAPLPQGTAGAVRRSNHPLIAGLGSSDLYWARGHGGSKPTAPLGGPVIVPPTLHSAALLTEPALLVAVPVGKGWVLIDQFAWDQALVAETVRVTRLVSCLARNVGAGFKPPADASRRYRFGSVSLANFANRGYVDETAGDGVGGWTDQGDNDMRWFLINHVGTGDGVIGGMAVATEAFPASAKFHGIPYALVDAKANGGKAVITLRGGPHDPASPAEVKGIAVKAKADRLWFLHAGCWGSEGGYGVEVARYEVVYADGSRAVIPVRQGQEISDWWNPQPLAGAQVAWTGRNAKTAPIGIYSMPWDNPNPEKEIATIDVIGSLAQTQLVLLAVTLGVDESGGRTVVAWDCGRFADGAVPASVGGEPLVGTGTLVAIGNRTGLRLADGQCLVGKPGPNPLGEGKPLAIEIDVAPDGKPGGYCGGLIECGNYQASGLRIVIGQDLRVSVDHWAGNGPDNVTYLKTREPLPTGRFSTVRYEHDGKQARLLVDGQLQEMKDCPPPAPYPHAVRIGLAGGQDYWFNGVVGNVRFFALPVAPAEGK